jgi:hypothetical protein
LQMQLDENATSPNEKAFHYLGRLCRCCRY